MADPNSPVPPGITDPTLLALLGGPMGATNPAMPPTLGASIVAEMSPMDEWRAALPVWARDLQLVGVDPKEAPGLFVWMKDLQRTIPGVDNPSDFDTPRGLRESEYDSTTVDTSKAQTYDAALHRPYTWDDEDIAAAIARMNEAGLPVKGFDDMLQVWEGLVDRAAKTYTYSNGEKKVTPWDVLDMVGQEIEASGGVGGGGPFSGTKTSVSRNVMEIDEGEAWGAMRNTVQQMLGRDPSDREVRDFAYKMNRLAARNPSVSRTTSTYEDGDMVSSSTRTKSGFTADDMAKAAYEGAQADPNYAEYQAASTYFNATLSALGAIGG